MLRQALTALHAACDIERDQVFVVDNGSSDDSPAEVAAFAAVTLIRNTCNNGFARACNQGIAAADGEFILYSTTMRFSRPTP